MAVVDVPIPTGADPTPGSGTSSGTPEQSSSGPGGQGTVPASASPLASAPAGGSGTGAATPATGQGEPAPATAQGHPAPESGEPSPGKDELSKLQAELAKLQAKLDAQGETSKAHEAEIAKARKAHRDTLLGQLGVKPIYRDLCPDVDPFSESGRKAIEDFYTARPELVQARPEATHTEVNFEALTKDKPSGFLVSPAKVKDSMRILRDSFGRG